MAKHQGIQHSPSAFNEPTPAEIIKEQMMTRKEKSSSAGIVGISSEELLAALSYDVQGPCIDVTAFFICKASCGDFQLFYASRPRTQVKKEKTHRSDKPHKKRIHEQERIHCKNPSSKERRDLHPLKCKQARSTADIHRAKSQ